MRTYYKRVLDDTLKFKLECCGAVQIKGPKWCGKSTTAEQIAASAAYLQNNSSSAQDLALAKNAPDLLLARKAPMLVDEWQMVPALWDQIRYEVDRRGENGQFILTGSATPLEEEDSREHSGIGRITPLTMRTMTLWESKDADGGVSLGALFSGKPLTPVESKLSLTDYAYLVCRGGWPKALGLQKDAALEQAFIYYEGLVEEDVRKVLKRARNPERLKRVLRSYARATSTETSIAQIRKDIIANDDDSMDTDTISAYINALERLYVVDNLKAWSPNLRSKTAVRTSDTRHFVDPSIATAALGAGPGDMLADLNTFGLLFESMCVRDLRTYAEALRGEVRHYRDANGLEADAIIHLRGGKWAAIEMKLCSQESIDEAAKHLLRLESKVAGRKPEFLMVLTATKLAHCREDGVLVVPLGCLEP